MVNSKSLKKEIFAAYLEAQTEIKILKEEIQLMENQKKSGLLKISDYKNDFSLRMKSHEKEINLLQQDLIFLFNFIQKNFKKIKTVELPAFIK